MLQTMQEFIAAKAAREHAEAFKEVAAKYVLTPSEREKLDAYLIKTNARVARFPNLTKTWVRRNTEAGKAAALTKKQNDSYLKGTTLEDYARAFNATMVEPTRLLNLIAPYIDQINDPRLAKLMNKRLTDIGLSYRTAVNTFNALKDPKAVN